MYPWAIIVNMLSYRVLLDISDTIYTIESYEIVAPPRIEVIFIFIKFQISNFFFLIIILLRIFTEHIQTRNSRWKRLPLWNIAVIRRPMFPHSKSNRSYSNERICDDDDRMRHLRK